ncbi:unnamed protein product [Adineta ricciae]|uniref:Uncharacterized protein n=1 Tax=Adineta ricciae TaxID=249248 RepID=A0A814X038_ADIRI|nr:unnamed protein product [Adineta ricciae]CAF1489901.1 unnamed protein product [Adineta ricciae]
MGLSIDKINPEKISFTSGMKIVNVNHAGTVYFVQHKVKEIDATEVINDQLEKRSHYGIAVDITGSSNEQHLIATHFDLYIRSSTNYTTQVIADHKTDEWNYYLRVDKVGKIPYEQILAFYLPEHYADYLKSNLIQYVFNPLCRSNDGPTWSNILNCQTFTRNSINYLECEFPSSVRITSDCIPTMMDFYIQANK